MKQNTRHARWTTAQITALALAGYPVDQAGPAAAAAAGRPMGLEPLEGRQMMTAVPASAPGHRQQPATEGVPIKLDHGVLSLTGSRTAANDMRVTFATAADGSTDTSHLRATVDGASESFDTTAVHRIRIAGGAGSDTVYVDPRVTVPTLVLGGAGNDSIYTGGGSDVVYAGSGDDVVYGNGSGDQLYGGRGNDTLVGSDGGDRLTAGGGDDDLVAAGDSGDTLVAGPGVDQLWARTRDQVIDGTGRQVRMKGLANDYLYKTQPTLTELPTATATATATSSTTSSTTVAPTASSPTATIPTTPTATTPTATTPTATTPTATTPTATTPTATTPTATTSTPITQVPTATPTTPVATSTGGSTGTSTGSSTGTSTGSSTGTSTGTSTGATKGQFVVVPGGTTAQDAAALEATSTAGGTTADGRPVAILDLLPGIRQTGLVVNVDGLSSKVGTGTCLTTQYAWDFGDASGAHDALTGFNAAHVYDAPGTYTVTLTVTNANGQRSVASGPVTVAASQRHVIYVDARAGSDANTGASPTAALKSFTAAWAKLADNTEILFKAGETFPLDTGLSLNNRNVLIGKYGAGADPVIMRTVGTNGADSISTYANTDGFTMQDLTWDTPYAVTAANPVASKDGVNVLFLRGENTTVRRCTFRNVDDAVNESGDPDGTLVEDNAAPLLTGLRGYLVWGQGDRGTIVGNSCVNSTREHCFRLVTAREVTIEDNTLANVDRDAAGDEQDGEKGCIEMHMGSYAWIADNDTTDGDIRLGPRAGNGESHQSATDWCVIQDNHLTDTMVFIMPGTHHAMVDNNVVNENRGGTAITVNGTDADGRESGDLTFDDNTVVNTSNWGSFIRVQQGASWGVDVERNVYVAPNLQIGYYSTAAVYVAASDLSGFTRIADNVWPTETNKQGGVNIIGAVGADVSFVTAAQWDSQSKVSNDRLEAVTDGDFQDGSWQMSAKASPTGVAAGASMARLAA